MSPQLLIVLGDVTVTRGGQTVYVRKGTVVSIDPANAALVAAYGGRATWARCSEATRRTLTGARRATT